MLIALAMVVLAIRPFAAFLVVDLSVSYFGADGILLPLLLLVVIVGVFGGLYPAFFLSRFQPASVLKANKSSAESHGTGHLRTALVIAQFQVSHVLILCPAIIYGPTVYPPHSHPSSQHNNNLPFE